MLLRARIKIRGSYRRSHHIGSDLQVLSEIKLEEAAFAYEIFGHTLVQLSAQLTLIDVFVLSSRAIGWLAPRIIMLDCSCVRRPSNPKDSRGVITKCGWLGFALRQPPLPSTELHPTVLLDATFGPSPSGGDQ